MANPRLQNFTYKMFGDRRDQRVALRQAGFEDEASAAAWAEEALRDSEGKTSSELQAVARLRRRRPDLTASTATYLVRHYYMRYVA